MSGVTITNSHKPGDNAIIRIRGLGTINNNDPLWIVDGVPGVSVPPEEIESISVLKDASSQAIYGARAANGVILVTTKSGRKNQKAKVKVTARTGIVQNTTDFGLLNTQEYGEYLWLRAKNSGIQNYSHALYGNGPTPDIPEYILPARATNVDHSLYDNLMIHEDGTDTYLIMKANREGTDWLSEISRNASFHQYGVDISGGSEASNYAFIGNYINQQGVLKHTGFERFSLRSNISSKVTDWLEIGERLGASVSTDMGRQTDHGEGSVMSFTYRMQPIVPVYDVMGNFAGSRAPETGNAQSPAFILHAGQNDYRKNLDVNGNFYTKATILKDFTVQSLFGFRLNSFSSKQFNMVEVATSERGTYDQLIQNEANTQQWNWTNTIQYVKSINQHNFDLIAGTEAVANEYKYIGASRSQFFFKTPLYMQLNVGERDITNNGSMSEWSLISQFGRLNYNYAHKYLFQATIRRDGSSRFGGENRYGVFPAFSAGWGISEEKFMESTKSWLDNLRLRVGWGLTGNDQIGNYNGFTTFASSPTQSYYPVNGSNSSATSGFYANAIGNLDARWETTTTTNIGLDAVLFRNFNFAIDFWNRKTRDMLYNKQIPNVLGTASPPAINVGDMENKGIDFNLKYQGNALANELRYDITLNLSHYQNEITNLSGTEGEFLEGGGLRGHNYTRAETGTAFPVFYGFIVDGIFQTEEEAANHPTAFGESGTYNKPGHFKYRNMNDDNVINDEDRTIIGSPHPDFTAGLYLNLEYKNFILSSFLYSSYGNEIVNQPRRYIDFNLFSGNRSKRSLYESWGSPYLENNNDAIMPIVELDDAGSQYPSTYYVEDGSYLRLENLMIGYNFNNLFGAQNNIQIYTQITNLFTISGYSGLDPEIGRGGMSAGVDAGAWPTPRQYLFGVNIDF
jgi:TonB-linked SusC/RagA family outer membrane protein